MTYSQIRSYFKAILLTELPDSQEWRDALVFDDAANIPNSLIDTRYHIEFSTLASTPATDKSTEDSAAIVLSLFKSGFNDPTLALDDLLDKALCAKVALINPLNVEAYKSMNSGNIDAVELVSIDAGEIEASNDNIVRVALTFNVRLYFGNTQP